MTVRVCAGAGSTQSSRLLRGFHVESSPELSPQYTSPVMTHREVQSCDIPDVAAQECLRISPRRVAGRSWRRCVSRSMQRLSQWGRDAGRSVRARVRLRSRALSNRFRYMEMLEQRIVLSAFTPAISGPEAQAGNSLRDAVQQANTNNQDDVIYLGPGTWRQDLINGPAGQENEAAAGDFDLTEQNHTIVIEGAGTGVTIVDGLQLDRLFHVHENVHAIFRNLTITNGLAYDNGFPGSLPHERPAMGGGILVENGTLELENVQFLRNTARGAEGLKGLDGRPAYGGAIAAVNSSVTVRDTTFEENHATGGEGGAGEHGQNGVAGGAGGADDGQPGGDGGMGGFASGAAIFSDDSNLTIVDSLFERNVAVGGRGGDGGDGGNGAGDGVGGTGGGGGQGGFVRGGAVFFDSGQLTVNSSVFQGTVAMGGNAGHAGRGGKGGDGGSGGSPNGAIGGTSNIGGWATGGGIWVGVGDISISQTRIVDSYLEGGVGGLGGVGGNGGNAATGTGGRGGSGGSGGEGGQAQGGAYSQVRGVLSITESEFADNEVHGGLGGVGGSGGRAGTSGTGGSSAVNGGHGAPGGRGGDGLGGGIQLQNVDASLTNVTISGNLARPGLGGTGGGEGLATGTGLPGREGSQASKGFSQGGGLWTDDAAEMILRSSTVTQNEAFEGTGGGIQNDGSLDFLMDNSIVAGNVNDDDFLGKLEAVSSNNIIGMGQFVEGVSGDANGNQFGSIGNVIDAQLGLLEFNGGPTRTHELLAGSPAIDSGLRDVIPVTDQRGVLRPLQSPVDIGAYEFQRSLVVDLPEAGGQYTLVADLADVVLKDESEAEVFRYEYTALLDVTINASPATDSLIVDFSQGPILPPEGVLFNGVDGAGDSLELAGVSGDLVTTNMESPGTGAVSVDGPAVSFVNVPQVTDRLTAANRTLQFGAGDDIGTIQTAAEAGYLSVLSGATGNATITATIPTSSLAYNGGEGNDSLNVGVVSGEIASRMIVDGQGGNDSISALVATVGVSITGGAGGDTIRGGNGNDTLQGGLGNDWLYGRNGNDLISGGEGIDRMSGNAGNDTMSGGAERDSLYGGSGRDSLSGDDGNDVVLGQGGSFDTVRGGLGDDVIDGGTGTDYLSETGNVDFRITKSRLLGLGNDKLRFVEFAHLTGGDGDNFFDGRDFIGRRVIFDGGAGNDSLLGSSGNDILRGGDGNDTLGGESGNDSLYGGDNDDSLLGGTGDDHLGGQSGNDTLRGQDGLDRLYGLDGRDSLDGAGQADLLDGGDGDDTLNGGDDDDRLSGGRGHDHVLGHDGNDVAAGDDGNDTLDGGPGNDSLFGNAGHDRLFGGEDADVLEGGDGDDDLHGQIANDTLRGNAGDDWLFGDEGADDLDAGPGNDGASGDGGNDSVIGGAGDDTLMGGAGFDRLSATSGSNLLLGEDGDDTLSGNGAGSDTLSGAGGTDVFESIGAEDSVDETAEVRATFAPASGRLTVLAKAGAEVVVRPRFGMVEVVVDGLVASGLDSIPVASVQSLLVRGSDGADSVDLSLVSREMFTAMNPRGILVMGRDGNDRIIGTEFEDSILGGDGADTVFGGEGDDSIHGGAGNDSLQGSIGEDLLTGDDGDDWLDGGDNADRLEGGDGNDTLRGRSGRDSLFGGAGNDGLAGHRDNDLLTGQSGSDTILGGDDDDTLYGGSGDDTLLGEFGDDLVNGQSGTDRVAGSHGYGVPETGDRIIGSTSEIDENFEFTASWIEDI